MSVRSPRPSRSAPGVLAATRSGSRSLAVAVLALLLSALGLTLTTTPASAAGNATVSILHAVPGATVDVYANGKALLTNFKPGTLTDPQSLPAGTYDLKVVKAGAGADGTAVAEAKDAKVPAGANITVVAHLDADGKPTLTPYVNDSSKVPAGEARLVVRHDAAAPAVDVRADKKVVFSGLTNPDEKSAEVAAGTVSADVTLAGKSTTVIGPADLTLAEGTTTIVYAWGSAQDDNLKLAVQKIATNTNPNGVPGGTGGQADATSPLALGLVGVGVAGLLGLGGVLMVRRNRHGASTVR